MYEWNRAYQYIMSIRNRYINTFCDLDTYSIETMCQRLDKYYYSNEYDNFLKCSQIIVYNKYNLFKYSLIKGGNIDIYTNPKSIYREMRGLVINMETKEIVLCPFQKFFNINEIAETSMDIVKSLIPRAKSIEITNKLDGSMVSIRYYHDDFFIAGTGSLNAENNFRLAEARYFLTEQQKRMIMNSPNLTFIFEYISTRDRHVVLYDESQQGLYLIGIRDGQTGIEYSYRTIFENYSIPYHVPMTKIENRTINEIIQSRTEYKGYEKEGWVINIDGKKFKLKCLDYLKLNKILEDVFSEKSVIFAIANNMLDDMFANIPKAYHPQVYEIVNKVMKYVVQKRRIIHQYYDKMKKYNLKTDSEFGKSVQIHIPKEYRRYMFMLRQNQDINILKTKAGKYVKPQEIEEFLNKKNIDK